MAAAKNDRYDATVDRLSLTTVCHFSGGVLQEAAQGVLHARYPQVRIREDTEERTQSQARRPHQCLNKPFLSTQVPVLPFGRLYHVVYACG
jgi:hypothetical protein